MLHVTHTHTHIRQDAKKKKKKVVLPALLDDLMDVKLKGSK